MRRLRLLLVPLILLTLTSLACSGISFLQPTPTPTATHTPTATPEPTSTPTPPPPPTIAPAATLPPSQHSRALPDGSTEFTDPEVGYRLVLPVGWLVLDLGAEDLEQAMQAAAEINPELAPFIGSYGDIAAEGMRLMALEMDAEAVAAGYVTNAVLIALEGMDMGLPLDFLLESTALSLEGMFAGAELISYEMIEDPNGLPLGRIDMQMPLTTIGGGTATVRSIWILAISNGQLVELTLQAESGRFAHSEAQMEQIVESFELLGE